jgi:hypothetical protein
MAKPKKSKSIKPKATPEAKSLDPLAEGVRVEIYGGRERGVILREADPDTGVVVTHIRKMDFLDQWLESGRINRDQYYIAQDFRRNFRQANCGERYKSIFDITNTNSKGGSASKDGLSGAADARKYVANSMTHLGRRMGEAVWHVVGLEWSLNEYSKQKRLAGYNITRDIASGFVEAGLEMLANYHMAGRMDRRARA